MRLEGSSWGPLLATTLMVAILGCGAPPINDYVLTAYMLRLGEEQRHATGRTLGEIAGPSEAPRAIRMTIPTPDHNRVVLERVIEEATVTSEGVPPAVVSPDALAVEVDRSRLVTFLKTTHEIAVVDAQAFNGRLMGGRNILRIEFVPRARSDESLLREFGLVCATVLGMDKNRTVDTILLLAVDAGFLPWMSLKTEMSEFEKYQSGAISLKEWRRHIETIRY